MQAHNRTARLTIAGSHRAGVQFPNVRTYYCAGDGLRCAVLVDGPDVCCWKHPPCSVCRYARQQGVEPMPHTLSEGRPCPYQGWLVEQQ